MKSRCGQGESAPCLFKKPHKNKLGPIIVNDDL